MSLHLYAPAALSQFLAEIAEGLDIKVGKARSSHSAHLSVPKCLLADISALARTHGLTAEVGRVNWRGETSQLVVKAPIKPFI
jgi:hypothetical protein